MKRSMRLSSVKGTCVCMCVCVCVCVCVCRGDRGEHERNDPSCLGGGGRGWGLLKEIFLIQNVRRSDSNAF